MDSVVNLNADFWKLKFKLDFTVRIFAHSRFFCFFFLHLQGTFQSAGVIQHAYNFNQPVIVQPCSVCTGMDSFMTFNSQEYAW